MLSESGTPAPNLTLASPTTQDWQGVLTGMLVGGTIVVALLNGYYHLGVDTFVAWMEGITGPAVGFWFKGLTKHG